MNVISRFPLAVFIELFLFVVDNVSGRKVPGRKGINHDFSLFTASDEDKKKKISPQLGFALFQYLSTGMSVNFSPLVI